jgi:rubrerythrin
MTKISRRQFLYFSAVLSFFYEAPVYSKQNIRDNPTIIYPATTLVLQSAFRAELIAHKRYVRFCAKALNEGYPNIGYLFSAFSASEKIHADNYKFILNLLGREVEDNLGIDVNVNDTKTNLKKASKSELEKIKKVYPDFLTKLEKEGHEEAIVNCMYSWKSHKQHEKKINEINKYAGMFFGRVAGKIEGLKLDFHVCKVCGSTIDEAPVSPCNICNKSKSNYRRVERPV